MKYVVGKSIVFCVEKPVKREVFAANFRDRIVHHLIINRINQTLENEFIDDSYSCRKGKGTDYGVRQCYEYLKEASNNFTEDCYVVKCDLKSFFMTINKSLLYKKLVDLIEYKYDCKDERDFEFMCWILKLIIFNEPQNNCVRKQTWAHWDDLPKEKSLFFCDESNGLPIGNLTSQIFANFYLSEFDHVITDMIGIKYYGRYVDDFFFICKTIKEVHHVLERMNFVLSGLGATLHPKKLYIQHYTKGVKFIGAVIKPNRIYVSNRTKGNFYWKIKLFSDYIKYKESINEELTLHELEYIVSSINSYIGFMIHYKSFNIRKKILTSEMAKPIWKYCYTDYNLTKVTLYSKYKHQINDVFSFLSSSTSLSA